MRTAVLCVLLAGLTSPAWALRYSEVVALVDAGVSDDTIIAQMEADRSRFVVTADRIVWLRRKGVSERVIQAMIATRKPAMATTAAAPPVTASQPQPSTFTSTQTPLILPSVVVVPVGPPVPLPPISYRIGPHPPMFVIGSPGVYGVLGPPPKWCPFPPPPVRSAGVVIGR